MAPDLRAHWKIAVSLVIVAALFIALVALQQPLPTGAAGAVVDRTYYIDYAPLRAVKEVYIDASAHTETLRLSTDSERLDFIIYTLLPSALADDFNSVSFSTNARIDHAAPNLISVSPKNSPNSITLAMQIPNAGVDSCTVNAVLPVTFVNSLDISQRDALEQQLLTLDLDLNCDRTNEMENYLAGQLIGAFS